MLLDGREAQRRARAMLAYADIQKKDLAPKLAARGLETSDSTLERVAGKRPPGKKAKSEYLVAIAEECSLPVEFFYADFTRLAEIVPADTVVIGRVPPPTLPNLPGEDAPPEPSAG